MVAILWVLWSHSQPWKLGWFSNTWIDGARGVRLFFALSGWLICNRLLRKEQRFGGISLRSFYTRRFFRLQPAGPDISGRDLDSDAFGNDTERVAGSCWFRAYGS